MVMSGLTPNKKSAAAEEQAVEQMLLEALHKEQAFLKAVLENAQDGIVACNAEGVLTLFNRATRAFHGLPEAAIPAEEWAKHYDLYRADGTSMRREEIPLFRALQGETVQNVEMVIAPKQGARRILLASGQALYDAEGTKLGAVVVMHDVTEQRQAEVERRQRSEAVLRESEQRFQVMADAAPMMIWMTDAVGFFTYFNRRHLAFTGRALEQEIGSGWTDNVHPEDLPALSDAFLAVFRAREPFEFEFRLRRHDSAYRWLLNLGTPRLLEDGSFSGYIGSSIDITERKDAALRQRVFLRDILAGVTEGKLRLCETPAALPKRLTPTGESIALTERTLRQARMQACAVAEAQGHSDARCHDLMTAVGEAAMNAIKYANGGVVTFGIDSASGTVQVVIADQGGGIALDNLHRATLEKGYSTGGSLGHGFWLMLQTIDRLFLLTGPATGTTLVLEQERTPPPPPWATF